MWPYLGPHEPIPTKLGLWMFFILLHRYMVSKTLKCKKKFFCNVIASVLYLLVVLSAIFVPSVPECKWMEWDGTC